MKEITSASTTTGIVESIAGRIFLQCDRAGVRLTKLRNQGHELFRSFRVVFGVFFQIIMLTGRKRAKPLGRLTRPAAVLMFSRVNAWLR